MTDLDQLADRVDNGTGADNALDVLVQIALFYPNGYYAGIRANAAGSKVIYTHTDGRETTYRANDWTLNRAQTAALLRARSQGGA